MDGHKIINQQGLHFVTFTVVGWIDIFTRKEYKDVVIESLRYCQLNKGLLIYSYVIMSNHSHMIIQADEGYNLSDIIRDFKKYVAKTIIDSLMINTHESRRKWILNLFKHFAKNNKNNEIYQFWQRNNKPIELVNPKWINQKINYIHQNPVKAGLVEEAHHYLYSSASNYIGEKGILDVIVLDLPDNIRYIT